MRFARGTSGRSASNREVGTMTRKWMLGAAVFAVTLALALPAQGVVKKHLKLYTDGSGAEIGWSKGPDSPADANKSALNIRTDPTEYAYAFSPAFSAGGGVGGKETKLGKVRNLSFDFLNSGVATARGGTGGGYVGAGAPRISVAIDEDGNGTIEAYAFLSAFYCEKVYPTNTDWSRADFTGNPAPGCTLFYGTETWSSDGTHSAWRNFALAHPTFRADSSFLIVDEATAPGRTRVDRIATMNHMQTSLTKTVLCPTEASC